VGHVFWQGRPPQPHALQQLPITLTIKSGTTEVNYPVTTTDSSGFFTETADLPGGVYNWRVKNPKYLANSGSFMLVRGTVIQVEMGDMRAGDCNDDNLVSAADFIILKNTFGRAVGEPFYDDRANFNGDNVVTAIDFNIMRINFGMAGSPPVMPESPGMGQP
jgi:dockerin type I repeat protein